MDSPGPPVSQSAPGDASFAAGSGLPQAPMLGQAACRGEVPSRAPGPWTRRAAPPPGPGAGNPNPSLLAFWGAARGGAPGTRPAGNNGHGEKRLRSAECTTWAPPGRVSRGQKSYSSAPPPGFDSQPRTSLPCLLWSSPAGPSQGSHCNQAEPSCLPSLHQQPPSPERPPATLGSLAPEYS